MTKTLKRNKYVSIIQRLILHINLKSEVIKKIVPVKRTAFKNYSLQWMENKSDSFDNCVLNVFHQ